MMSTDLFEPRRVRIARWAGAALFVVIAHVGCTAMALWQWPDHEAEDSVASPVVVEMVPALAVRPVDSPDVAHGPLMEEAMLTPQATKETKEKVETEMPAVDPSPAPDPEVQLPEPQPVTDRAPEEVKPKEEKPKEQSADQAAAAPLTTAPPRVEATEQPVSAAASPGSAAAAARAKATWERALVTHLNRFKRYPDTARAGRRQGDVSVQFTIDHMGGVIASRVVQSSGSQALDDEALAVLQRASPLPAPPGYAVGSTLNLTLPIQFRLH